MWQVTCDYKRDKTDTKCKLCKNSEDTTEHLLECEKTNKFTVGKENTKGEWKKQKKERSCFNSRPGLEQGN